MNSQDFTVTANNNNNANHNNNHNRLTSIHCSLTSNP